MDLAYIDRYRGRTDLREVATEIVVDFAGKTAFVCEVNGHGEVCILVNTRVMLGETWESSLDGSCYDVFVPVTGLGEGYETQLAYFDLEAGRIVGVYILPVEVKP